MPTYAFCDTSLASSLVLPELIPLLPESVVPSGISFGQFVRGRGRTELPHAAPSTSNVESADPDVSEWLLRWEFPDKSAQVFRRNDPVHYRYRIDFVHGPQFYVSADGTDIAYEAGFGNEDTVRHLLIDQVLPRVLSLQGALMLHAACIDTPSGAIAIFGESGQGKSTLSYALQESGCRVLSDDCAKIELIPRRTDANRSPNDVDVTIASETGHNGPTQNRSMSVLATSTYRSLRLWPDVVTGLAVDSSETIPVAGYHSKQRIHVASSSEGVDARPAAEVVVGIILGDRIDGTLPEFSQFGMGKAMLEMVKQTFHLDVRDRAVQQRAFRQIDELVRVLPTYHFAYPSGLDTLPEVARFLIERVSNCAVT